MNVFYDYYGCRVYFSWIFLPVKILSGACVWHILLFVFYTLYNGDVYSCSSLPSHRADYIPVLEYIIVIFYTETLIIVNIIVTFYSGGGVAEAVLSVSNNVLKGVAMARDKPGVKVRVQIGLRVRIKAGVGVQG